MSSEETSGAEIHGVSDSCWTCSNSEQNRPVPPQPYHDKCVWYLSEVWKGVLCRAQLLCFPVPVGSGGLTSPGSKNAHLSYTQIRKGYHSTAAGRRATAAQGARHNPNSRCQQPSGL